MKWTTVETPEAFVESFERAEAFIRDYFADQAFRPEAGTINISGQRYTLVRAGSMAAQFFDIVRALYGETASDEADAVGRSLLFDVAHAMGIADASVCAEAMGTDDPIALLSAGPVHFAYAGWASVRILPESNPTPGDGYVLVYDHPSSFESDSWLASSRATDHPVCVMNAGYSSGWCERCFQLTLVATEITCRAKGDAQCRFVMAPPGALEDQIRRYLDAHPDIAAQATAYDIPGFFAREATARLLRESASRLDEYNADLELRVQLRTAELTASNAQLEASQALNETIREVLPGGIVHVDARGAITVANGEALRILGLSHDELTNRYTSDFDSVTVYEDGRAAPVEEYPVSRALATGRVQGPTMLGVRRPDGVTSWAVFRAAPIVDPSDDGRIIGAVVTFFDMTERKAREEERLALEAQMREAQKLESLGLLAGGVAHDFNNLLVGILGQASLLAEGLPPDSALREAVDQIELAASRAADLAQQMLAYSGSGPRDSTSVDLSALTREMLGLVRASIPATVTLVVDFAEDLPMVEGDPAQLRQVVMNLILNAAEAVDPATGTVRVCTGEGELTADDLETLYESDVVTAGRHVYVEVADDGTGMADDTVSRIFDPFFTTKSTGRGLGLAAVRGIVRSHHGALDIATEKGTGTRFKVWLPTAPDGVAATP